MASKGSRSELSDLNGGEPPTPHRSSSQGGFVDLDELRDANGLLAIISQRRSNGVITMAVFKEFDRDGRKERTSFIPELLFDAYESLVKLARERIKQLHAAGELPIPTSTSSATPRR